jgi:hypothetical protein
MDMKRFKENMGLCRRVKKCKSKKVEKFNL